MIPVRGPQTNHSIISFLCNLCYAICNDDDNDDDDNDDDDD